MEKLILVICDNKENVFVAQLAKQGVGFVLANNARQQEIKSAIGSWGARSPDVVLLVNRGQKESVQVKKMFPQSKVLACFGGGKKDFQPYVVHIAEDEDYDYYNYKSWDNFVKLVIHDLPYQEKLFRRLDTDVYEVTPPVIDQGGVIQACRLEENFNAMLRCSIAYLGWLLNWLREVKSITFSCRFHYQDTVKKRLKMVFISLPPGRQKHLGKQIFEEDDDIMFNLSDGEFLPASVSRVTEDGIIVSFEMRRQSVKTINKIVSFNTLFNERKTLSSLVLCQAMLSGYGSESCKYPFAVLRGLRLEAVEDKSIIIQLSSAEQKILRDTSQVRALADILGPRPVVAVEGPPGTGKTFLTAVAIKHLLSQGKNVLVTSHSNRGLDSALEQAASLIPEEKHKQLFRLGNNADSVIPVNRKFHRSERYNGSSNETKENGQEMLEVAGEILPEDSQKMSGITPKLQDELNIEEQQTAPPLEKQESGSEYEDILELNRQGKGMALFVTLDSFTIDWTMQNLAGKNFTLQFGFFDEATKGYQFEMIKALMVIEEKIVFIGDYRQLGNIRIPESAEMAMYHTPGIKPEDVEIFQEGFFYSLVATGILPSNLLKINRRSLRLIADLVSELFYGGELISGRFNPLDEGEVAFLDTALLKGKEDDKRRTSYFNPVEKNLTVKQFIGRAKGALKDGRKLTDCAIITPYQAQISEIRQSLRKDLLFNPDIKRSRQVNKDNINNVLGDLVDTVDAFQGSQRFCIIMSLVRSNENGDIGFNVETRRFNVGISRAEDKLIVIGDSSTFLDCYDEKAKAIFQKFVSFVKQKGTYRQLQ